jgi:hypothetical protein
VKQRKSRISLGQAKKKHKSCCVQRLDV